MGQGAAVIGEVVCPRAEIVARLATPSHVMTGSSVRRSRASRHLRSDHDREWDSQLGGGDT